MSLAENLLNSLPTENAIEGYSDNEEEEYIVIDNTRKITVPTKLKTIAVTGDKDVETVTFRCVRYWDEHDLSAFDIYINYILPNGESGTYIPQTKGVYDYYFEFQWIIGWEITRYKGGLSFLITAVENSNDGTLSYQWSSLMNNDCTIAQGIIISDTPSPLEKAFEEGRKAEYDAFWESYMPDQFLDYDSHFAGRGWNDVTFKPPYEIPRGDHGPTSFSRMFANSNITNLSNVKIKWDKATRTDMMFYWTTLITELPEIDLSNVTNCNDMFSSAPNLVTIEKLKVSPTTQLRSAFYGCDALKNIVVEGEIAYDGLSFAQSTELSKASIESIIYALSEKGSGRSITLSKDAVDVAFYDSNKDKDGSDSAEWEDLISERDNWTINLV